MVNRQKIMIVDDDENIAELISLYLTKECFNTRIVHDGESAMREFDTYGPNLVLLDLMLPGMDGYQVCRELRQRSSVPIIILSAKSSNRKPGMAAKQASKNALEGLSAPISSEMKMPLK